MSGPAEPLRVLLVDDEPLARTRLRTLLGDILTPPARVIGEAATAAEAEAWFAAGACDLVLLDVQMPGLDGLRLAGRMRRLPDAPAVVFVTAHAAHAVDAFELDAVDYLTKPVRRERLQAALQRVAQRRATRAPERVPSSGSASGSAAASSTSTAGAEPVVVIVADRGRVVRVPIAEVLYFKAELKYVTLRTAAQVYLLDEALADLEARHGARFLRVHRNALVARAAVRALERRPTGAGTGDDDLGEGWAVQIAAVDEWLAVSRRQVAAVREALVAAGG